MYTHVAVSVFASNGGYALCMRQCAWVFDVYRHEPDSTYSVVVCYYDGSPSLLLQPRENNKKAHTRIFRSCDARHALRAHTLTHRKIDFAQNVFEGGSNLQFICSIQLTLFHCIRHSGQKRRYNANVFIRKANKNNLWKVCLRCLLMVFDKFPLKSFVIHLLSTS